jgi:hypothetical protein
VKNGPSRAARRRALLTMSQTITAALQAVPRKCRSGR